MFISLSFCTYLCASSSRICIGKDALLSNAKEYSNNNLDICTYGGSITSCYPNNRYAKCSGTSQATPLVSGALALLKQKFRDNFNREPLECELYAQLIKNTKELKEVNYRLQGNGKLYFVEGE